MIPALNRGLRHGIAGRKISLIEWLVMPFILAIALTWLLGTSVQPFGNYLPEPVFPFAVAFAWGLIRPSMIAPIFVALMGFFLDFFWNASMGLWALSLTIVYFLSVLSRTFVANQDWTIMFGAYIGLYFIMSLVMVILTYMDTGMVTRLIGIFEQAFATCLCFPFVLRFVERYVHVDVKFQ